MSYGIPDRARSVIDSVISPYGVTIMQLRSLDRTVNTVRIRNAAIQAVWSVKKPCGSRVWSAERIGRMFCRDRLTVLQIVGLRTSDTPKGRAVALSRYGRWTKADREKAQSLLADRYHLGEVAEAVGRTVMDVQLEFDIGDPASLAMIRAQPTVRAALLERDAR